MKNKLAFLTSTRFWALVGIAIIGVLNAEGILATDISMALITILSGFIGIRTVDRSVDKLSAK
jgi:hypothetical protein